MEKHGLRRSRIYGIWCGVKNRCNCPTSRDYKNYGAKGIKEGAFLNYYLRMGGITNKQKHVFKFVKRYWTKEDIAECRIRAKEISEIFGW